MSMSRPSGLAARLPRDTLARLEETFAADFRSVAVTVVPDPAAGPPAFAVAERVVVRESRYRPDTPAGLRVLAHEFAHVAQKRLVTPTGSTLALEAEADAAAEAVLTGRRFRCGLADHPDRPRAWGEAGHYYTCYMVLLAAGVHPGTAYRMARYCQLPDEVDALDAAHQGIRYAKSIAGELADHVPDIWKVVINPSDKNVRDAQRKSLAALRRRQALREYVRQIQEGLHCLTGRRAADETKLRARILDKLGIGSFEFGLALHAYGDSFAHRKMYDKDWMYVGPVGHAEELWGLSGNPHAPDQIHKRKDFYREYGLSLYEIVVKKTGATMTPMTPDVLEAKLDTVSALSDEDAQIAAIREIIGRDLSVVINKYAPESKVEGLGTWEEYRTRHPGVAEHLLKVARQWALSWSMERP